MNILCLSMQFAFIKLTNAAYYNEKSKVVMPNSSCKIALYLLEGAHTHYGSVYDNY